MEIDDIQNVAPVIERVDVDAIAKRAVETEREKVVAINAWARKFDLSDEFSARLVAETADKDEAQKRVFAEISSRPTPTDAIRPAVVSSVRDIGVDSARSGLENAIEHRINPSVQLTEEGRDFAGLPLLEMGRSYLGRHNISTRGMSAMDLAGAALNLSHRSMGTTDFPYLLANTANKRLASSYEGQVPSFEPLCRRVPMNDFKAQAVVKFGDAPVFESVSEDGTYKIGAISEGNESYQLATYGKKVVFTRQMMINDDLRALDRLPDMFARRARELESDLFWAQITGNPTMGDSVALFHATHGNLGTGVIALAGLGAARKAVQVQTGLDGGKLGLRPRYLVVPVALEDTALQWTSQNMTAAQPSNVNPYANRGYEVISDPRLDDSSLLIWYLAASTDQVDIVEMGYLASSPGIYSEVREGFDVDGVEIKYRIDRTAKVIDHRGLYRSSGA
jgi:hypothetical protein